MSRDGGRLSLVLKLIAWAIVLIVLIFLGIIGVGFGLEFVGLQ